MSVNEANNYEVDFIQNTKTFLERWHDRLMKEFRELEHIRNMLEEISLLSGEALSKEKQRLLNRTMYRIEVMEKVYGMSPEDLTT